MKFAVVFEFKEGMSAERAHNLALGIATMVNASVRGEPDVKVNFDHKFVENDPYDQDSKLDLPEPLSYLLETS